MSFIFSTENSFVILLFFFFSFLFLFRFCSLFFLFLGVKVQIEINFLLVFRIVGHPFFDTAPISSNSYVSNVFAIRRLNSDVPRSGNPPVSPISLRHRSLPALPSDGKNGKYKLRVNDVDDEDGQKSPATCPGSPMPSVRFAVGEVVSSGAVGMLGTTPTVARLIASEQNLCPGTGGDTYVARTRCNSLGSSSGCRTTSGGTTSPVPIPLSPQTLASLGIANNREISQSRFRHCSCSSQTDLNGSFDSDAAISPNRSSSSLGHVPTFSCSLSIDSGVNSKSHGRSSPSNVSQSSEDDLRAYLKEVTKELATEIKSEIREVISKVDDVLSETNTCETTPQHQSKQQQQQQQQQHDSFSASDIAEYLMEFSKEMASEVKSEIRCMVNSVDGLHR